MKIKDRIKELRRVKASELMPNSKNWRTHPTAQRKALEGILETVGYADALIARESDEGLILIDGHLRAETTPDAEVPVLILDINEEEADLMLATLDPLSRMATVDQSNLTNLLESLEANDLAVNKMLTDLADNELSKMPNLSFLDEALEADEDGIPFPAWEIEGEVHPDVDGLVRFTVPVTVEQRTQIMNVVNKVKGSHDQITTTAESILLICNSYEV